MFYLQLINSLEGLGMFFSSAALIRRLRKHTATGVNMDPSENCKPTESGLVQTTSQVKCKKKLARKNLRPTSEQISELWIDWWGNNYEIREIMILAMQVKEKSKLTSETGMERLDERGENRNWIHNWSWCKWAKQLKKHKRTFKWSFVYFQWQPVWLGRTFKCEWKFW